jgi:hypothetical protein
MSEHLKSAFHDWRAAPLKATLVITAFLVLFVLGSYLVRQYGRFPESRLLNLLFGLALFFWQAYLTAGLYTVLGRLGERSYLDLLRPRIGAVLGMALLDFLRVIVMTAAFAPYLVLAPENGWLRFLLLLAGVALVVWYSVRFALAGPRVALHNLSIFTALGDSWHATNGRFFGGLWRLFAYFWIGALGILAGGVGLLVTIPIAVIAYIQWSEDWTRDAR